MSRDTFVRWAVCSPRAGERAQCALCGHMSHWPLTEMDVSNRVRVYPHSPSFIHVDTGYVTLWIQCLLYQTITFQWHAWLEARLERSRERESFSLGYFVENNQFENLKSVIFILSWTHCQGHFLRGDWVVSEISPVETVSCDHIHRDAKSVYGAQRGQGPLATVIQPSLN